MSKLILADTIPHFHKQLTKVKGKKLYFGFVDLEKVFDRVAELLCCDCVFCNSLVFYVSAFYFILWAVVSAAYSALLSSSYFERINDDDDGRQEK